MLGFFRSPLGVDFGSSALKVAQIKGTSVNLAAVLNIEGNRNDPDALGQQLSGFFGSIGATGRDAIVNVPGSHAFIRTVSFPSMPEGELKEALTWEVKRQLPYHLEDAIFDYVSSQDGDTLLVTYAATERKYSEEHLEPLRRAGLNLVGVDINPLCLLRTIRPRTAGNTVVVDIGATSTEIHVFKNGVLRITRTVEAGGEFMKKRLVSEGADPEEADRLLREGSADELGDVLRDIMLEVFRSIDYYKANFKEKGVSEIIVTGGPSLNPQVVGFFKDMFGLPVSVPDPFNGLALSDETLRPIGPIFPIAVGLAKRKP